ncbi:MAG: WD40 repeat domain-containing protein [Verrucomicrobiota bacterium]
MNAAENAAPSESLPKVTLRREIKLPTAVLALALPPDGSWIFAACMDGGIYRVEPQSGSSQQLSRHASYASGVCWLDNAQVLVSAGYDGVLQWHDLAEVNTTRRVAAHRFWSWKLAVAPDESLVASATGQFLAGGYKYEPAAELEPSVRVFDAQSGELRHSWSHVPPVLSVAFSPDSQVLAAGNLMGEVRVWEIKTGRLLSRWTTPDFTSWGTVKSHHYIGGIFDLHFTPDGAELLACGMGPMDDPMAGNGKQTWQRYAWRENPPHKTAEIADTDRGNGLMETLAFHPNGRLFAMAGRLAQGKWNVGLFHHGSGQLLHSLDTKMRVTAARFTDAGRQFVLGGAVGQEKKKDGHYPEFGRIQLYDCVV